ncbi:MAG: valine--tRNA ligase [bacterium]|nr:valine--tRNA ligase [bacterium]
MKELPKAYEPQNYEDAIYKRWENSGFFNPDNLKGEPYSIMMPPPNVTGVLHLGHALENALMDTMARYQRMQGKKVLLVPGTDHAALPTQAKVEKMLIKQGMKNPRQELGREKLVEKIREFAEASKSTILNQVKKMGTSCDWSRLAYTFDQDRNTAVNQVFEKMYNDGLIYRGYRVVNWSVKGQSTCSDDEVEHVERTTKLYTFKYSKDFPISIASTQPETKLGDTAVAVHPTDKRYKKFIGKTFVVDIGADAPREIKIIADPGVEPDFGTGALGVTPAHSQVDFAMYEKQKAEGSAIALIPVIGVDGKMTEAAGKNYVGLTTEAAREKFVSWLRSEGLLEQEEEIMQNVGTSDRFGDVIEAIPMTQWWLDMNKIIPGRGKSLKDLMREAVTDGLNNDPKQKVNITPDRFKKLYLDRIDNLRDWCLSRQIWWGHQIPVFYCHSREGGNPECAKPIVSVIVVTKCSHCGGAVEQDPDTLDTWFSSGGWTFSTLGWPNSEQWQKDKIFHPTAWMQMGYEIVYLWMMRMILMSSYVLDEIPFKDVYIHGMVRDESGKKFSKSSDNGIDPIDVIKKYGCDALRLSVLSGTTSGNDSRFFEEKIEGARNLVNKLWNISRFMLLSIDKPAANAKMPKAKTLADNWLLDQLNGTVRLVSVCLDNFQFSGAADLLRTFTWDQLADWYLEIAKIEGNTQLSPPARGGEAEGEGGNSKSEILNYILNTVLKLWHPFAPFVTEAIWKEIYGVDAMIMVEEWPRFVIPTEAAGRVEESLKQFEMIKSVIIGIRSLRAENKIEPIKKLDCVIVAGDKEKLLSENIEIIKGLARLDQLLINQSTNKPINSISFVESGVEVYIDLAGAVDTEKEKARLEKEIAEIKPYAEGLKKKLSNAEFVNNAPLAVVEKEKQKLAEAEGKLSKLSGQLANLK